MGTRTPPFDYARASALMDQRGVEALLVCSRANVGYLADYTYYTAQAYVGEDTVSTHAPEDVAEAAVAALRDRGLGDGGIALELAAVPASRYLRLRELLPDAELV